MANSEWGPLAGLIGTWEGGEGVDISFHNEKGEIGTTPFREVTSFKPFGPVDNGKQSLYGLDYRTAAWREGEENPFHTEVGYWLWDAERKEVMRCFMVPRGSTILALGVCEPDATEFIMGAELGSKTNGILSNPYLDEHAQTILYDCTITVDGDTFSYDETTTYNHYRTDNYVLHTDRNTLRRTAD